MGLSTIYVINLPTDRERLEWFRQEMLSKWPDVDYEVVPAVVGAEIPEGDYRRLVDEKRAARILGRDLGHGEAGLVLSHHKIFEKMISSGVTCGFVFEDDARIGANLKNVFPDIVAWMESRQEATVLLLSEANKVRRWLGSRLGNSKCRICSPIEIYGTYGFVVNLEAAKRLLAFTSPVFTQADDWARYRAEAGIRVCSVVPFLVGNNDFDRKSSSLSKERSDLYKRTKQERKSPPLVVKVLLMATNVLKKAFYWMTGVVVVVERSNRGLE